MDTKAIELKKVTTRVRPGRHVVIIKDDQDWMAESERAIEWFSEIWGGFHNVIVPSDGTTIDSIFWDILNIYQPDYVAKHIKTTRDLQYTNPEQFNAVGEQVIAQQLTQGSTLVDAEAYSEQFLENLYQEEIGPAFEITQTLKDEIADRLNPFHEPSQTNSLLDHFYTDGRGSQHDISMLSVFAEIRERGESPILVDLDLSAFPKDLQLLVRSIVGSTRAFFAQKKSRALFSTSDNFRMSDITLQEFKIAADNMQAIEEILTNSNCTQVEKSIFKASQLGLGRFHRNVPGIYGIPTIIITGGTLKDFCLYYSLSRLTKAYWFPNSFFEGPRNSPLFALLQALINDVGSNLHANSIGGQQVIFTSISEDEAAIQTKVDTLDAGRFFRDDTKILVEKDLSITKYLKKPVVCFENNEVNNVYLEQFLGGYSINLLQVPKPKTFSKQSPFDHRWLVDLEIKSSNEKLQPGGGYILPTRSYLADGILFNAENYTQNSEQTRWTHSGLTFFCPTFGLMRLGDTIDDVLVRPQLHLPDSTEVFEKLFQEAGFYTKLSEKGQYMRASIELFGSIASLVSELSIPSVKEMLDSYKDITTGRDRKSKGVCVNKRSYLSFEDIASMFQSRLIARTKVDEYLKRGVFQRGFILKCEDCRESEWYELSEIGQQFQCRRCQKVQTYTRDHWRGGLDGNEPPLYYRLHEMIYQGHTHNMAVPIMMLNTLHKGTTNSFLYTPELELRNNFTDERPFMEIDVIAITDGLINIGEAKITAKVPNKLSQYNQIVNKLNGRFLYGTLDATIPTKVKRAIEALSWKRQPLILDRSSFQQAN